MKHYKWQKKYFFELVKHKKLKATSFRRFLSFLNLLYSVYTVQQEV